MRLHTCILTSALMVLSSLSFAQKNAYDSDLKPQSGQFFKNKHSDKIVVADCRLDTPKARMVSTAFQGMLNQKSAEVYLYISDHHVRQLNDSERKFEILKRVEGSVNGGLVSLFERYSKKVKNIYLWDPESDWTWNMAVMMSAHNNGIPLPVDLKDQLLAAVKWNGKVVDLRNNWKTKKEAYQWAIDNIMPKSHKNILFSVGLRSDWKTGPWTLYDYTVASKGFAFWLDDVQPEEQQIIKDICVAGKYAPGSIVMGYAKSGDDLLTTVNGYGIGYVVSDYYSNGSFWCSYPNKSFRQKPGKAHDVEPGKIYVSVVFSDGDNLQFDQNALYDIWTNDKLRGQFPVGTTLCAGLQEINPFLLEWYYKHMTDNDELMAGPSGYQFIYGRDYQESGYEKWLELNRKWLASAGFETGCFWHTTFGTDRFNRYIKTCGLKGVFDGDDMVIIACQDDVVIMNQGAHLVWEGDLYNSLHHIKTDPTKPIFINTYPTAATYGFHGIDRLRREMERLDAQFPGKYVFLLPKDLVASARKYYQTHPNHTQDRV